MVPLLAHVRLLHLFTAATVPLNARSVANETGRAIVVVYTSPVASVAVATRPAVAADQRPLSCVVVVSAQLVDAVAVAPIS